MKKHMVMYSVHWLYQILVTVSMAEFKADGIGGDWGINEDGDFTIEHLENLEVGDIHTVYAPYGWSIKITKIKEVV
jgi:predicted ferric reductase